MYWCDDYICPVSSRLDKLEYSQHPCIPYDSDGDSFVCLQNEKEQHILAFLAAVAVCRAMELWYVSGLRSCHEIVLRHFLSGAHSPQDIVRVVRCTVSGNVCFLKDTSFHSLWGDK